MFDSWSFRESFTLLALQALAFLGEVGAFDGSSAAVVNVLQDLHVDPREYDLVAVEDLDTKGLVELDGDPPELSWNSVGNMPAKVGIRVRT